MVVERLVLVGGGARGEERIVLGKVVLQPERQRHHVPRGGHLGIIGQARGIAKGRGRHAELVRLAGHEARELLLAAGNVLGDRHGNVVGALGDENPDGVEERDLLALGQIELGGCGRRGVGGHLDLGLIAEPALLDELEGEVDGHHLGERGRMARLVGRALVQDAAGIAVDHQHGAFPGGGVAVAGRQHGDACKHRDHGHKATPTPWPAASILSGHSLSVQRRCAPAPLGEVPVDTPRGSTVMRRL